MDTTEGKLMKGNALRVKYLFICINVVFFIAACIILGVGIWIALENNDVTTVFEIASQTNKMRVPIMLVTVASGAVIAVAFLGGYGAHRENQLMVSGYIVGAVLIFLMTLIGAILALVARSQVDDRIRSTMRQTITNDYGRDTFITNTWDYAQVSLYCCAVEDSSWSVYRSSAWYDAQPGIPNLDRPMVPASCCVRNQYHELLDIQRCQTTITGPPYVTGGDNKTLYHRGCYSVVYERNHRYSMAIAVTGFMLGICMCLGIVVSIVLFLMLRRVKGKS